MGITLSENHHLTKNVDQKQYAVYTAIQFDIKCPIPKGHPSMTDLSFREWGCWKRMILHSLLLQIT